MPETVTAAAAKARLAEYLRLAEGGGAVLITRHGKPAAALVPADHLDRIGALEDRAAGAADGDGERAEAAAAGDRGRPPADREATPEELLARAAAASLRRVDRDLERAPEELKALLRLIRDNLFLPGFSVTRARSTLGVGSHNVTTDFRRATGATIRRYVENRRLECVCRLLLDTDLDTHTISRLVGYGSFRTLSRAFDRRFGCRPRVFRQTGGRLSRRAAKSLEVELSSPLVPRFVAAVAGLPEGARCGRCGRRLERAPALRIFEDFVPICDRCAHGGAGALDALFAGDGSGDRPKGLRETLRNLLASRS